MKKIAYIILAGIAIMTASCSKNMNSASPSSMTIEQQKTVIASGAWNVTLYRDKLRNNTSDFSGYTFLFNSDGTLTVNGSNETVSGTWSLNKETSSKRDDMFRDTGSDDNQMYISAVGTSQMNAVSDDWTIIRISDTELWLKDENPLSGKEFHFSR